MMDLRTILAEIQSNSITKFELVNAAKRLKVDISGCEDFSKQKLHVKREVLLNLLREASVESEQYEEYLSQTNQQLVVERQKGFSCMFVGCPFKGRQHRDYVRHLKDNHFNKSDFLCNYNHKCKQRFASIRLLEQHVVQIHQRRKEADPEAGDGGDNDQLGSGAGRDPELSTPCKCIMASCGYQHFTSIQKLRLHYSSQVHSSETRPCIFEGCDKIFAADYRCRQHFSKNHSKPHQKSLKPEFMLVNVSISTDITQGSSVNPGTEPEFTESEAMDTDGIDQEDVMTSDDELETHAEYKSPYQMFLMSYADFLNRLAFVKMVPQTTIQIITEEYYTLCKLALKNRKAAVFKRLKSEDVPTNVIEKVMTELDQDDCLKAQVELNSAYKREQFIKENFKFNAPLEIVLNKDEVRLGKPKQSFQYISVRNGVKILFEDPSFNKILEKSENTVRDTNTEDVLTEIRDGALIKNIPYYRDNPSSYVGILYSDAVEIVSPLGASRGRYKILQMFWSLGDISKQFRSKVDNINLCIIVQDSVLKKYGYHVIYKPLIDELKLLETDGIVVDFPIRRRVKVAFTLHIGDNLESHSLGGFSRCFSSKDICRFCHCSYDDLENKIHDYTCLGQHQYWTMEEYDERAEKPAEAAAVEVVVTQENLFDEIDEPSSNDVVVMDTEEATEIDNQFGVRERCPFNDLASFHAIYSFPPDSLHDILEGVAAEDILAMLKILISKKYFTEAEYNKAIRRHKYVGHESNDRPELIDVSKSKLKGKALSINTHLRNIGFYLSFVNARPEMFNEESFLLIQKLHSIVEFIMAPVVRTHEIQIFEEEIVSFLNLRQKLFEKFDGVHVHRPKPKTHFLSHYPEAITLYGPMINVWTARYEAKHRIAKMLSNSAKNFLNISKTLAVRQQFRQSSMIYSGLYETEEIILPTKGVKMKHDLESNPTSTSGQIKLFMDEDSVLSDELKYRGQNYRTEDVVILEAIHRDHVKIGVIMGIIIKMEMVFFLVKRYDAFRDEFLRFFEANSTDEELGCGTFVLAESLVDYKPLVKHGNYKRFRFVMHHHVSVGHSSNNFTIDPTI